MSHNPFAILRHDMFELEFYSYKALAQALKVIHKIETEPTYTLAEASPPPIDLSTIIKNVNPIETAFVDAIKTGTGAFKLNSVENLLQGLGQGTPLETSEDCAVHHQSHNLDAFSYSTEAIAKVASTQQSYQRISLLIEARENLKVFNMSTEAVDKLLAMEGVSQYDLSKLNKSTFKLHPVHEAEMNQAIQFVKDYYYNPTDTGRASDTHLHEAPAPNPASPCGETSNSRTALSSEWFLGEVTKMMREGPWLNMEPGLFQRMTQSMAQWLDNWLEQPETLEHSELYTTRMAGISSAALGYCPSLIDCHPHYVTPALKDTFNLYEKYNAAYQFLQSLGYSVNNSNWYKQEVSL